MRRTIKSKREINALFKEGSRIQTASILAIVGASPFCAQKHAKKQSQESEKLNAQKHLGLLQAKQACAGRVAVIAGKRLGSAPCRSRAKRLIREAARLNGAPWAGSDVLLIAKTQLFTRGFAFVQRDIQQISVRIKQKQAHQTESKRES